MLVALVIEDVLETERCMVVGPFNRVEDALRVASTEALDLAVLDVNVAGVKVFPVAEMLSARGIPFLLLSGYGESAAPSNHPEWRACGKPIKPEQLVGALLEQANSSRLSKG